MQCHQDVRAVLETQSGLEEVDLFTKADEKSNEGFATRLEKELQIGKLLKFLVHEYDVEVAGQIETNREHFSDIVAISFLGNAHATREPLAPLTFHTHPLFLKLTDARNYMAPTNQDVLGMLWNLYRGWSKEGDCNLVAAPEGVYVVSIMPRLARDVSAVPPNLSQEDLKVRFEDWYYDASDFLALLDGRPEDFENWLRWSLDAQEAPRQAYGKRMIARGKMNVLAYEQAMATLGLRVQLLPWKDDMHFTMGADPAGNDILRWAPDVQEVIESERVDPDF
ncbi:hypothetical protein HDV00_007148 [Rhizophlyctis rosea]|nr:hypothetical protein HDV00_007148 [Rhizophlyctis rosea]